MQKNEPGPICCAPAAETAQERAGQAPRGGEASSTASMRLQNAYPPLPLEGEGIGAKKFREGAGAVHERPAVPFVMLLRSDVWPCGPSDVCLRQAMFGPGGPRRVYRAEDISHPEPPTHYISKFAAVRGKGPTSRMLVMPVTYMTMRSRPRPNPACSTPP